MIAEKKVWSRYQKSIFENVHSGTGHTVIIARAGSGKSTTIVESFKYLPKKIKTLVVAFNKSIADAMRENAASYIDVKTVHSLGFAAIKSACGKNVALDPDKTVNIITAILDLQGIKKQEKNGFETIISLAKTVSLCKSYLIDIPSKIDELMDRFDVDTFLLDREQYIKVICQVLRRCKEIRECIDFDDMVHFPYIFGIPVGKWDVVYIDEMQDLSAGQIHMALSACKKGGRIIGACDPEQAIYSWRGADTDSVGNIIKQLNAKVLPLSISYRCAKNIVALAQEIVPDIEAATYADDGIIKHIPEKELLNQVKPGDFILSRVNAPLIYHCLALLRMGIPANIQGKDVGANLSWMIKKSETKTVPEFQKWLDNWKAAEIARLRAKNRDPILVIDKAACLETLCEGAASLDEVKDNIKTLFNDGDDSNRVILSSIHKAKGMERDRVFILNNTLRRGMNKEEDNLCYVSWTRARKELFLVDK